MKDKAKFLFITAGLLGLCSLLVFGIGKVLYKPTVDEPIEEILEATEDLESEDEEIEVTVVPEISIPVVEEGEMPQVIIDTGSQKIQEDPIKPEAPTEAPELKEGEDITDPNKMPEYIEPVEEVKPEITVIDTTPKDEGSHPGMVYFEGFGWVKDEGASQTIDAPDMFLSGEKVGDM